ncbi:MAG: ATP-binding cassette domain-containing protein [Defluviitaleaceae bacterium]|nr:ATP-binding cassette domain-containing protein [Defluviitaleaceae bacterium]
MLLSLSQIKKSFTYDVIKNATFAIAEKEKIGLIGVNGAGKSTLFKIITGELTPDSGHIALKKDTTLGYLSQSLPNLENTVYQELSLAFNDIIEMESRLDTLTEEISKGTAQQKELLNQYDTLHREYENAGGYIYKSRLQGVIKGLGFQEDIPVGQLSGGQKTTLSMARLLLGDNALLLLDEPTNHLDLKSVAWLEVFLSDYNGAVVVISHDRYFINRIATKIVEMEHGTTTTYKGNYDAYVLKKQEQQAIALHHYQNQQREIKAMEESIKLLKSFNREKSVKRARSKEKALDKIERLDAPMAAPHSLRLNIVPTQTSGSDVLTLRNFSVPELFSPINLDIKRGERVALIGPVGIGKSTMFRAILGNADHIGTATFGTKVTTAYYEQHQEQGLNLNNTVMEEIHSTYPQLKNVEVRNALASFTFTGDDVYKIIDSLSGGEKAKVLLAKITLSGCNFLMLDEPTNHLDIISKEILEEALQRFSGTCLFISHDRYFINKTATKIVELSKDGIVTFLGDHDYYIEKTTGKSPTQQNIAKEKTTDLSYHEQKQEEAAKRKAQNRIKAIEIKIADTEKQIENAEQMLNQTTDHARLAEIYENKEKLEHDLLKLYEELEEEN